MNTIKEFIIPILTVSFALAVTITCIIVAILCA